MAFVPPSVCHIIIILLRVVHREKNKKKIENSIQKRAHHQFTMSFTSRGTEIYFVTVVCHRICCFGCFVPCKMQIIYAMNAFSPTTTTTTKSTSNRVRRRFSTLLYIYPLAFEFSFDKSDDEILCSVCAIRNGIFSLKAHKNRVLLCVHYKIPIQNALHSKPNDRK